MVKGTSRRVIIIKSPDPRIFDEAIFLVKEDAGRRGVTGDEIIREAQAAADRYIAEHRSQRKTPRLTVTRPTLIVGGAALIAIALALLLIF